MKFFWQATLAAAIGCVAAAQPPGAGGPGGDGVRQERRLLVIGEGPQRRPIEARVGEVIQFSPFALPVVPPYADEKAVRHQVKLEGDVVLDEIGQLATPARREGRYVKSVFFLVREAGRTEVELTLMVSGKVDTRGDGTPRFRQRYVVDAGKPAD
jgi:hypothetical protein